MVDLEKPELFAEFLDNSNLSKDIYDALRSADPAEPVIAAISILRKIRELPKIKKTNKSEEFSEKYRREANDAYLKKEYQFALEYYNKALMFAPPNSLSMKLAYSNRSAVLIRMHAYQACLRDIDTCFTMGCPPEVVDKLKKRKDEAYECMWKEKLGKEMNMTNFNKEFFEMKVKRNPQIPAASADIGIIMESGIPKVVAIKDIQIGNVVAVETAFVSNTTLDSNQKFSCYYCQKISLNLIPCDSCVLALFCSEHCKTQCLIEYHHIECQIMGFVGIITKTQALLLVLKVVLKIKTLTTWDEFIEASKIWGLQRIKQSSVNEIFDGKFATLCFNEKNTHFVAGQMFNSSFIAGLAILYLDDQKFFPQSGKIRSNSIKAFSRMLMCLCTHGNISQLLQTVTILSMNNTKYHDTPNFGCFTFMSKLKHACDANSLYVALNNKLALVAVKPIKRGTEITASQLPQWLDLRRLCLKVGAYRMFRIACDCPGCNGTWEALASKYELNEEQRQVFYSLNLFHLDNEVNAFNVHQVFPILCKALVTFYKAPYCYQTVDIQKVFRKCILILQDCATSNVLLGLPSPNFF